MRAKTVVKSDNHRLPSMQISWLTYRHHPLQMRATTYPRRLCIPGVLANASSGCLAQRLGRGHRTLGLNILGLLLRDGGLFDDGLSHIFHRYQHRQRFVTIHSCSSDIQLRSIRIVSLHHAARWPSMGTVASRSWALMVSIVCHISSMATGRIWLHDLNRSATRKQ